MNNFIRIKALIVAKKFKNKARLTVPQNIKCPGRKSKTSEQSLAVTYIVLHVN